MYMLMLASLVAIIIPIMVFSIAWILAARSNNDREKSSPFECGFDPTHNARIPFSLRFFLLAIIFIVFDIEIVLLIPMPLIMNISNTITLTLSSLGFLLILIIGLFHEWNEGSLNWTN